MPGGRTSLAAMPCRFAYRSGEKMKLPPSPPPHPQLELERLRKRNVRLRLVCRRLNQARHEISQQVDLLCNDLVRAYQEMAQQLNLAQTASEFAQALSGEL